MYAVFARCRARRHWETPDFSIGTNGCSNNGAFESFGMAVLKLSWTPNTAFGAKKGDFFCTADVSFVQEPSPHVWHTRPKKASLKSNLSFHGKPKRSRNGAPHSKFGSVEKTQWCFFLCFFLGGEKIPHRSDHLWSYRPKGHVTCICQTPSWGESFGPRKPQTLGRWCLGLFYGETFPKKPTNIGSWDVIHVDVKKALGFKQGF